MHRALRFVALSLLLIAVAGQSALAGLQTPVSKADRLVAIANAMKPEAGEAKLVPLVTEALRHCGFVIWDEDRKPLLEPSTSDRLGIAITDAEIGSFTKMFVQGHGVQLGDLVDSMEFLVTGKSGDTAFKSGLIEALNELPFSEHESVRNLGTFLMAQTGWTGDRTGLFFEESQLNAVQGMVLLRVVTEEFRKGAKKAAERHLLYIAGQPLFASTLGGQQELPGWAEDGGVSSMGTYVSKMFDLMGLEGVSKFLGKFNLVSSIVKFMAMYACLKADITMENSPLVRRTDTSAGEQRKVNAKFYLDAALIMDFAKTYRKQIALLGMDVDMPKSGPLSGVETKWEFGYGWKNISKNIVQVPGFKDISKVVTNDQGIATVTFEGAARARAINKITAVPVMKIVGVTITPQMKSTEMKQDLVDALFGGLGALEGGSGFLAPIMETLYRLKWKGAKYYPMPVRDWEDGKNVGSLTIEVNGSGSWFSRDASWRGVVDRKIDISKMPLEVDGVALPYFDPAIMKNMPPEVRKQMEEGLKEAREAARYRAYRAVGPGTITWRVQDSSSFRGDMGDCETDLVTEFISLSGNGSTQLSKASGDIPNHFMIQIDEKEKTATIEFMGTMEVTRKWKRTSTKNGTKEATNQNEIAFDTGLIFGNEVKRYVLPLKSSNDQGELDGSNYYGAGSFPFSFGFQNKGQGTIIISYAITRAKQPGQ